MCRIILKGRQTDSLPLPVDNKVNSMLRIDNFIPYTFTYKGDIFLCRRCYSLRRIAVHNVHRDPSLLRRRKSLPTAASWPIFRPHNLKVVLKNICGLARAANNFCKLTDVGGDWTFLLQWLQLPSLVFICKETGMQYGF
jgi:hypothetical protein